MTPLSNMLDKEVPKRKRCAWAETNGLFIPYHDKEWGVPVHDDRKLFEMLNLEGAQAGLSWLIILKRRQNYRQAFDNFDAKKIAKYNARKCAGLLKNPGIIRNRLKIKAVVGNAKAYLEAKEQFGSFHNYIWSFISGKPLSHAERRKGIKISEIMSADLKDRGFRFVGPTICFAFMQAVGLINDHSPDCFQAKK